VVTPAAKKELGVGMEWPDLRSQQGRRQGDAFVVALLRGPHPCERCERELVGGNSRSCEVQPVEEVEDATPQSPARWFWHAQTVADREPCIGAPRILAVSASSPGTSRAVIGVDPERVLPRVDLTVVVPVYNGGDEIVANVEEIRRIVAGELPGEEIELVVVSDGSIDGSAERLLESRSDDRIRVIHYDRNLGKGYAVKAGSLAARGDWVALVDADLDLDPGAIPAFLGVARSHGLDFAIGSKRHPESIVVYPRSRRAASWCYQQLNRFLFRLDVRDTQVGLKVFSRGVVDDVVPLLLVKRYAFDLELLAVSTALGYGRIEELPVRLDYRFTGSGVGSRAALQALWDTAAIFYRLRILRTYERKRRLVRRGRLPAEPLVSVRAEPEAIEPLDYFRLEHLAPDASLRDAAGEIVAVLGPRTRPAGNWVTAAVPYFADPDVAAVIAPTVAPLLGSLRTRAAAAVLESRLGSGSRRLGYFPGNVRFVADLPAESVVARRTDLAEAEAAGVTDEELVAWLAARGRRTVYTPDTSLTVEPAPLVRPHLADTFGYARARGSAARRSRGRSLSSATALSLAPAGAAVAGGALLAAGATTVGAGLVLAYAGALALSGAHAALRFRSVAVGVLEPPAVVASQAAYLAGFVRGLSQP
jgi:glycosyltransferase involved in cell wall biosynthesis